MSAYHAGTRPPARADFVVEPRAPVGRYTNDHAASCADGCANGPMAVSLTFVSNVGSGGKLDREIPSQNIILFLLELDDILVSASAAESIDLYCVGWDGLLVLTCSKQKNKVTINCEATVLEYKSCFDLSSSFWRYFRNHLLMKLAKVAKRSLQMLNK